jgi:hypothetical protein
MVYNLHGIDVLYLFYPALLDTFSVGVSLSEKLERLFAR